MATALPLLVPANPLSLSTTYAAAGFWIWQGVAILFSHPRRLSSPSIALVREHQTLWGAAALAAGILVFVGAAWGYWWVKAVGLMVLFAWCITFATMTLHAFITNPVAGPTGPPVYYFAAATLFILVWVDRRVRYATTTTPPTPSPILGDHRPLGSSES